MAEEYRSHNLDGSGDVLFSKKFSFSRLAAAASRCPDFVGLSNCHFLVPCFGIFFRLVAAASGRNADLRQFRDGSSVASQRLVDLQRPQVGKKN